MTLMFANPFSESAVVRAPRPSGEVSLSFATTAVMFIFGFGVFPDEASDCCTFSVTLTITSISTFGSAAAFA